MKERLKNLLSMLLICILGITLFIWLLLVNFDVPMAAPCRQYLKRSEERHYDVDEFMIKDKILIKYQGSSQHVVIPKGIIEIGSYAFSDCEDLKTIELPEGVVKIDSFAFYNCCQLTIIEMPDSLTEIERQAFYGCKQLKFSDRPLWEHERFDYKDLSVAYCSNNCVLSRCAYWKHCLWMVIQYVIEDLSALFFCYK